MSYFNVQPLLDGTSLVVAYVANVYGKLFFSFGPSLSLPSLFCALCVATLFIGFNRVRQHRHVRLKVLVRALFPRRIVFSRSTKADVGFFFLNSLLLTILLGWAVLSYHEVMSVVLKLLSAGFGTVQPTTLTAFEMSLILTVAMFVAAELGYYADHYLSHRVPFLWEFHKVHHAAEVLTPLTTFRVHPVDTLVYYNTLAITMGVTGGIVNHLFGQPATQFSIGNSNVIVLVFIYLLGHLQHSHFWIAFTGLWGRVLLSPAHHQIHHSTNPIHFNKNLGNSLGIFDWLFGTLHVPSAKREKLTFGVEPGPADPHTVTEGLIAPVGHAIAHLLPHSTGHDAATADAQLTR
jgi:sterol desaturase/sphingolipid hydroxylase (fatty acid hydroxylase superfamily)